MGRALGRESERDVVSRGLLRCNQRIRASNRARVHASIRLNVEGDAGSPVASHSQLSRGQLCSRTGGRRWSAQPNGFSPRARHSAAVTSHRRNLLQRYGKLHAGAEYARSGEDVAAIALGILGVEDVGPYRCGNGVVGALSRASRAARSWHIASSRFIFASVNSQSRRLFQRPPREKVGRRPSQVVRSSGYL